MYFFETISVKGFSNDSLKQYAPWDSSVRFWRLLKSKTDSAITQNVND